jgi:hypothetical protein
MLPEIFGDPDWQMRPSERAALNGLLTALSPDVAIEIGTAGGGSLRAMAARANHVHAFDLAAPAPVLQGLSNVTFHTGDSHVLLPAVLDGLARERARVEFALVDGDHTAAGVRQDIEDLLASPAVTRALILVHDTANEEVRRGTESVDYEAYANVTWVDLDWLPGYVDSATGEAWAGLGLIVVEATSGSPERAAVRAIYAIPLTDLIAGARSRSR